MQPVMVTAAIVGAEVTRAQQPYLPITPQEIIQAAVECYEAGAAIIHIHVRDAEGNATQDAQLFREVVEGIRAHCDVITQVSTGGAVWMSADERLQSIECRPDMATLTTGSWWRRLRVVYGSMVLCPKLRFLIWVCSTRPCIYAA